ncbi:MAG: PPOX class F420-dependent oxidoreductase [Nitriliruptorales bacterium]|nr:PPOX class F420-dependent oxidoreductase [Nitriliruptorales bacterium]
MTDHTEFIQEHHRAVLHTYREDGSPQLSPVVVVVDDEGRPLISTRETAVKAKNLARDPRLSLCVFTDEFYGPWIRVDGQAEIVHLPDAMDLLVDYYRRARGEHDDWEEYEQAMRDQRRVIIRVDVEEVGPSESG